MHSRSSYIALIAGLCVGLARSTEAQTAPAPGDPRRGVTLSSAITTALRQNPDLLVARTVVDSADAERGIAHALPNPQLAGNPNSPYQYVASIPLDITPQRFYRQRTANLGVLASRSDEREAERQVTLAVARAFFDALLAQEQERVAVGRRDAVLELVRADSIRFRAGDVAERNVERSEVELARADADVARAAVGVQSARLALQAVMGVAHPDTGLAATGSLEYHAFPVPGDSAIAIARAHRPDLDASERRVEQSASAQHAAASLLVPTPQLAYVRQYAAPFDNGHYFSLGLTFELPSLNLYRGQRERAAAGRKTAQLNARRNEVQVERDVVSTLAQYRAEQALVERYRAGVVDKVDRNVEAMRYAYARGGASLLELLDAIEVQRDARLEYATALHDYWVSVYALDAALGTDVLGLTR